MAMEDTEATVVTDPMEKTEFHFFLKKEMGPDSTGPLYFPYLRVKLRMTGLWSEYRKPVS